MLLPCSGGRARLFICTEQPDQQSLKNTFFFTSQHRTVEKDTKIRTLSYSSYKYTTKVQGGGGALRAATVGVAL